MHEMMDIEEDEQDDEKNSDGGNDYSDVDYSPLRGNKSALHEQRVKTSVNNIFNRSSI